MAVIRIYEIEAMSNGYSIRILEGTTMIDQFVVGGMRAGTKPETMRRKLTAYAVADLKKQIETAIDEADNARPELPLAVEEPDQEATEPQED